MTKMMNMEGSAAEEAMDAQEMGKMKAPAKGYMKKKGKPATGKVAPAAFLRAAKKST